LTDLPQILIGELGRTKELFFANFCLISCVGQLLKGKKANTVIYDQARVNGGSNYEYPGQRCIFKLMQKK